MRRPCNVSSVLSFTDEVYDDDTSSGRLLVFSIPFTASPYVPAKTWGDPDSCHEAEGGEIDLGEIEITEAEITEDGNVTRTLADLSAAEKAALVAEFEGRLKTDGGLLLQDVYDQCRDEAAAASEYYGD